MKKSFLIMQFFKCTECENTFSSPDNLDLHMKDHDTKVQPDETISIECNNCDNVFSPEEIKSHMRDKHAVKWVRDSILCLTEVIARLENLVTAKFEE